MRRAAACLLIICVWLLVSPPYRPGPTGLEAHFIDVGDADSTLIVCGGAAMLVDGGDIGNGHIVTDYLRSLGIQRLDVVVGTHPHADHMGGLSEVIEQIAFGKVYASMASSGLGVFRHFQRTVEKRGGRIEALSPGASFPLGGATVTVMGPQRQYDALNNMSLVLRVDYGGASLLIQGDAQQEAEADIIDSGLPLRADVLRVGHHGSNDATSEAYLSRVKPRYAVIACGDNDNGHPHRRLLALLDKHGVKVFRTDLNGTIVARTGGADITFSSEKR